MGGTPSGFIYGNPAIGVFEFVNETSGMEELLFDTSVSNPTAITVDGENDVIFFANAAPFSYPWISMADTDGEKPAYPIVTANDSTPYSVVVSDIAFDSDNSQIFYLFKELNPNKPIPTNSYSVIQTSSVSNQTPTSVLTVANGTILPNSFDIDPASNTIYFTANGMLSDNTRHSGGIYSMNYDGSNLQNIDTFPILNNTDNSIGSIQYEENHLFYIISTQNLVTIYKYHLDDNTIDEIYNSTGIFTPEQIITVINNGDVDIWVRDGSSFYLCPDEDCDDATTPEYSVVGSDITDFDISEDSTHLYYVGIDSSSVFDVTLEDKSSTSVINGINTDTNTWVDSENNIFYYSGLNRIDSVNGDGWNFVLKDLPFLITHMDGDSSTGNIVISSSDNIYLVNPSTKNYTVLVSATTTAIAIDNGILYFATPVQNPSSTSIKQCDITDCTNPSQIATSRNGVTSITVDENGSIYYGTPSGIFTIGQADNLIPYSKNIMPFAVAYSSLNDVVYFLDIQDDTFTVRSCNTSDCSGTLTPLSSLQMTTSAKYNLNGWLVIDDSETNLYWAASSIPGQVYGINIENRDNLIVANTSAPITGLAISSSNILYVASGTNSITQYNLQGEIVGSCELYSENLSSIPPVGDIEVYNDVLLWSDAGTGDVYECPASTCNTDCASSSLIDSGTSTCTEWQFITAYDGYEFNQLGCGGIVEASINQTSSTSLKTLKEASYNPIADLAAEDLNTLIWALPFRYSLVKGTVNNDVINPISTFLSGTGDFGNLIVKDNTFYWIDISAEKIVYSQVGGSPSDFVYQPAVGLSYVSSASSAVPSHTASSTPSATPSSSIIPSISVAPSSPPSNTSTPTPSTSVSTSATASASASATASASASMSVEPSRNASSSPTSSASVSMNVTSSSPSVSPTGSISSAMSAAISASASASMNVSVSSSASVSVSVSSAMPTNSSSASVSGAPSNSATASISYVVPSNSSTISVTISVTPSNTPPASNSSSVTQTPTSSLSFGASPSVTPTITPSISLTISYTSSNTRTPFPSISASPSIQPESPILTSTAWEWLVVITIAVSIISAIILFCCWRSSVEKEMALSLKLPDTI